MDRQPTIARRMVVGLRLIESEIGWGGPTGCDRDGSARMPAQTDLRPKTLA